jgi:hypothetical protein
MALAATDFIPANSETFQAKRYMDQVGSLQPGVFNPTDYQVTALSSPNATVNAAGGDAWVQGQSIPFQGLYHQLNIGAVNVGPFTSNTTGNPRVDQVLLVTGDSSAFGSTNIPSFVIATGTGTIGAQINTNGASGYRAGAVSDATLTSLYGSWLRLSDILIPTGGVPAITQSMIVDRRPWARGGNIYTGPLTGSQTGTSALAISSSAQRLELGSNALCTFSLSVPDVNYSGGLVVLTIIQDGTPAISFDVGPSSNSAWGISIPFQSTPGSHLFSLSISNSISGQTANVSGLYYTVVELLRASANNGSS